MKLKFKHHLPLILFIVPTIVISAVLFIVQEPPNTVQLIGFIILLFFVCVTYYRGIKVVLDDIQPSQDKDIDS